MKVLSPPLSIKDEWPFVTEWQPPRDYADDLPVIGIITPSYNQGQYLEATIRSVLLQGYPRLEYYIEDGGSSDSSVAVIKHYAEHLTGWVSERDRGQSHAINKGFARFQSAEITNWLNSDDYLMPGALWKIAEQARHNPDANVFIGGARRLFPEDGSRQIVCRESVELADVLYWHERFLSQPASWFTLELFNKVGGLREDLHHSMDFDMWIRMFSQGARAHCFDDVLVTTVHHEDAKTVNQRGRMYGESAVVLMENGYREEAIRFVERNYSDYLEATRIFRKIKGLPGGRAAMDFYNKHLRRNE